MQCSKIATIVYYTICKCECGAGGNRTLVQTWNQCAFYMLIHDTVLDRK